MCEKLYIKKINPVFAIAKTKAEDNINIISLLNSAYKTSDEQYFLNEKAVCQRYGFPAYVTVDIT